jgi:putative DNA primase/helicase
MSAIPQETGLYRRFELAAKPGAPFVMVSSERGAEAAHRLIGQHYIATTWPEYPGAWRDADLSALVGRQGLLIPDATPDARQDMHSIAARLLEIGCKLRWTDTDGQPVDWSPEDWEGTADEFIAWAKARTKDYEPPAVEQPPEPQEMPPAEFPPEATLTVKPAQQKRQRPQLVSVDGNTALAPEAEAEPAPIALSETAFAQHFADIHGENWRCVRAWGKWFNWDGEAWMEDRTDSRVEPMRQLFVEAQDQEEARTLTPSSKRALLGRKTPIYSALILAGTDKRIRAEPEIWDADPWALGVPSGVVDLQTGKLVESAREQHVTMRCSVAPARGEPTLWLQMLSQWMGGDADVIGFLRRYLGYSLCGDSREQCMAFFYGQAQSGKGTILRAISGILGSPHDGTSNKFRSYHYEAPISTFMESRNDRHTTELAAFYKKRLITSEEPSAGAKWDEGKLKWITGGSQITARFISQDNFSFSMTGKIIVAANHRPRLATTDKAIRRRMMVIPFEHPVADEDRDNQLDAKLRAEWPQILHWLIEGCLEWQDAGLGLPERIADSTDQYLELEDTMGSWLDECCERERDSDGAALYRNYRDWCEKQGDHPFSRRAWTNALLERGFQTRKGTGGMRMMKGLNLKLSAQLP